MAITHTHVALPTFDAQDAEAGAAVAAVGPLLFDELAGRPEYAYLFTPPAPSMTAADDLADTTLLSIAAGLHRRPEPAPDAVPTP